MLQLRISATATRQLAIEGRFSDWQHRILSFGPSICTVRLWHKHELRMEAGCERKMVAARAKQLVEMTLAMCELASLRLAHFHKHYDG